MRHVIGGWEGEITGDQRTYIGYARHMIGGWEGEITGDQRTYIGYARHMYILTKLNELPQREFML